MIPFLVVLFLIGLGLGIVVLAISRIDAWRTAPERREKKLHDLQPATDTALAAPAVARSITPPVAAPPPPADPFAHIDAQPEPRP